MHQRDFATGLIGRIMCRYSPALPVFGKAAQAAPEALYRRAGLGSTLQVFQEVAIRTSINGILLIKASLRHAPTPLIGKAYYASTGLRLGYTIDRLLDRKPRESIRLLISWPFSRRVTTFESAGLNTMQHGRHRISTYQVADTVCVLGGYTLLISDTV